MTAVSPRIRPAGRTRRRMLFERMFAPRPTTPAYRLVLVLVAALALMGLIMVLSASSVVAIGSSGSA